jgi:DNA-binding IclR family transcriptional regulator
MEHGSLGGRRWSSPLGGAVVPVMSAPSVTRAARLLAELAAHPDDDPTLSQLARRLNINKTSCQSLLLALADVGLVIRGEDRTYRLGAQLVHLGEAAKSSLRIPELVGPVLADLAGEFGVTAMSSVKSGDDLIVVATNEVSDPLGVNVALGQRIQLRAPFGPVYVAWGAPDEIARWIDRAEPPLAPESRTEAIGMAGIVRHRGCSITVRRPELSPPASRSDGDMDALPALRLRPRSLNMEYPGDPPSTTEWSVLGVGAPVFDGDGMMLCSVAVTAFPYPLRVAQVSHVAGQVRKAADRVTVMIGGRAPVRI